MDRDGHVRLLGTPAKLGNLDHWLDKAKKSYMISGEVLKGNKDVVDPPADCHEWSFREGNIYTLKVFKPAKIAMMKALYDEETWNQEFMCIDTHMQSGYYHRDEVDKSIELKYISPDIDFDPSLPLRVYFDLGIGTKSNKMAYGVFQFSPHGITALWGEAVMGKGYLQACEALRKSKYGEGPTPFFEIVLPHDAASKEQSDAIPKQYKFDAALLAQGISCGTRVMAQTTDMLMDTDLVTQYLNKPEITDEFDYSGPTR